MTADERSLLQQLDRIVRSEQVRVQILPIVERVRAELTRKQDALMAWEPIALTCLVTHCQRRSIPVGCSSYVPARTLEQSDIQTATNECCRSKEQEICKPTRN